MLKSYLRKKNIKKRRIFGKENIKIKFNVLNFLIKKTKINKIVIGGYFPVNYEIDCLEILKKLETKNFGICLPKIKKNNEMEFYKYSFDDPLQINSFGIPEPLTKKKVNPDILLVPLVAFDRRGYRIGYGGGFYDRYFEKLQKRKNFISIGLAYSFQIVNKVPNEAFDKPLNLVATEKKIYK